MRRVAGLGLPAAMAVLALVLWFGPYRHMELWTGHVITDIPVYQQSSDATASGKLPYRDVALEYPPGAAALFWAARFMPGDYAEGFMRLMALAWAFATAGAVLAAAAVGYRRWRQIAVGVVMAATPLLLGSLVATRFDAVVTALMAWTIVAAVTERWRAMWLLVAAAILVKLMPVLLIPVLAVWQAHRTRGADAMRGVATAGAVVAAVLFPIAIAAPSGLWDMLAYHLKRPVQIESLASSYMLVLHNLADVPVAVGSSYGSQGLAGRGPSVVAAITTGAGVVALVAVLLTLWRGLPALRRGPDARLMTTALAATVVVLLVSSKVLSPQFMLWVLPAALLAGGPYGVAALGTTVLTLVATQLYFPRAYWDLVALHDGPVWLLAARNAALVALVAMCWPRPRSHRRRSAEMLRGPGDPAAADHAPRARFLMD